MKFFTLDQNGVPRLEPDQEKWSEARLAGIHVANVTVGEVRVSTIFLGMHCGPDTELLALWETMVFGGPHHGLERRCGGTSEQAQAMHNEVCAEVGLTTESLL